MTTPELVAGILNTLLTGLALAAIVWLALRLLKPLNSGTRFAIWFSALVAIVVLPFLGLMPEAGLAANDLHPKFVLPESVATYLFAVWGVIATALLVRLGLSLLHVRRLRRHAIELKPEALEVALRGPLPDSYRRVRMLVSDRVRVPAAIGFFSPAIIVPTWALRELSVEDFRTILLHELAHLRRWDDWTNLAQKVLKALFFFHPAVWWIESRLSLEREMACDDLVLAATSSPRAYATSLISLAERVGLGRTAALAQAALGRARHTSLRIAQILDSKRPSAVGIWKPALGFGTVIAAVVFVAVPHAPDLVAFTSPEAPSVASAAPSAPALEPGAPEPALSLSKGLAGVARPGNTAVRTAGKNDRVVAAGAPALAVAAKAGMSGAKVLGSAHLASSARRAVPQEQVVLLMQSTQFDETGTPVFTFCVWQITDANRQQVRTEIVVHSL